MALESTEPTLEEPYNTMGGIMWKILHLTNTSGGRRLCVDLLYVERIIPSGLAGATRVGQKRVTKLGEVYLSHP